MQFRECYHVRCYRIHLKGKLRKRSPQEQHQAPSHLQANQFHKPYRPANSAFANKPQKTTSFFNPHNITRTSTNYNTYSHNPIPPYSPLGPRALITQTQSNPYHQDTISVGSTLLYNHHPTFQNTTARMISQLQKSNRIHMIIFLFYAKK